MSEKLQVAGRKLQDYFSLLGLSPGFDIDLSDLEKRYFIAQRTFHPDRIIGKSAQARQMAISQSMLVNTAYETLKIPLKRALYMLSLKGITSDSSKPSQELLMEIMELREELAEAQAVSILSELESKNTIYQKDTIAQLTQAFDGDDFEQAAQLTTRLSYLSKIYDEIRAKKRVISEKSGKS